MKKVELTDLEIADEYAKLTLRKEALQRCITRDERMIVTEELCMLDDEDTRRRALAPETPNLTNWYRVRNGATAEVRFDAFHEIMFEVGVPIAIMGCILFLMFGWMFL